MLTNTALKKVQPLVLDGPDYREAEARLAVLLFEGSHLFEQSSLKNLTGAQGGTLAAALEMAKLHGLLEGRDQVRQGVVDFLTVCEQVLHPGDEDLGPKRWNPERTFEAPRLRQRLRELGHLRAR